jgi:superoxide reductase
MDLIIKRCLKCGATVEVLHDCTCENCGIKCCGQEMQIDVPNTVDAAVEKHLPVVEVLENYIVVSVPHVMEEDHYIEWISLAGEKVIGKKFYKPNESPKAIFPYRKGSTVYAYCNKHGLWSTEVK